MNDDESKARMRVEYDGTHLIVQTNDVTLEDVADLLGRAIYEMATRVTPGKVEQTCVDVLMVAGSRCGALCAVEMREPMLSPDQLN